MASRVSLIQSRSIYVGTSNAVAPSAGDLVVSGGGMIGVSSQFTFGGTAKLSVYADAPITFALSNTDAIYFRRYGVGQYQFQTTNSGGNTGDLSLQSYGGNVGIGTTSPGALLHVGASPNFGINNRTAAVYGSADSETIFTISRSGLDYPQMLDFGVNQSGLYSTISARQFTVATENKLVLQPNGGNVGIGTTNPSTTLDVLGKIKLGLDGSYGVSDYVTIGFGGTSNGYNRVFGYNGTSDGLYLASATGRGISFRTNGGSTDNMFIAANGNVCIGTTNPTAYMSGTYGLSVYRNDYPGVGWANSSSYWLWYMTSSTLRMWNSSAGDVLTAHTTGNVLIGTTTDTGAKLRVYGGYMTVEGTNTAMYIESNYAGGNGLDAGTLISASGTNSNIIIIPSGGGVAGSKVVGSAYNGSAWRSMLEYANVSSGEPVLSLVKTAGNVGIGTTAPALTATNRTVLSVNGTNSSLIELKVGDVWKGYFYRDANRMEIYDVNAIDFSTNGSIRATINSSGNVGIGTTAPFSKTTISKAGVSAPTTADSTNNAHLTLAGSDALVRLQFGTQNVAPYAGWIQASYDNGGGVNGIEPLLINPNGGNVIIGSTTDAGYKLDVHGEILGRDDIRILNTFALILNGTDANWRIGRNTITDSGWLTGNTMQMVVFGGSTGQGFQVVNHNGTALFEIDGVAGASRFTNALGVGVNPSGTAGRIDASNDIVAYSTSDQRLKKNITPIANALDKVKALTGVEFDWKEDTKAVHGYEGHDVGVIAQEVQSVLPEAVRTNDSGYLSVRYEKMIALLVEANKELASRVEELEKKLK